MADKNITKNYRKKIKIIFGNTFISLISEIPAPTHSLTCKQLFNNMHKQMHIMTKRTTNSWLYRGSDISFQQNILEMYETTKRDTSNQISSLVGQCTGVTTFNRIVQRRQ